MQRRENYKNMRKNMKKLICMAAVAFMAVSAASAQDYKWAVGARFGGELVGGTVKYNIDGVNSLEAMLATPWDDGFLATVLYERHIPVIDQGFHFYYGAGGHIGEWKNDFAIGIDGIIGLEYKIRSIPLALSLDYKPIFNIAEDTEFYMADIALGFKVTF